jgi:hypothetical protein
MHILFAVAALVPMLAIAQDDIKLQVDATDAPRRMFHVRMTMPVKPGPMTLLYPEWIPGEHVSQRSDQRSGWPKDSSEWSRDSLETGFSQYVWVSHHRTAGRHDA